MILFLDTTDDVYSLALATREGRVLRTKKITRNARIGDAVFRVIRTWAGKKRFSNIVVVTGPGRFSGIRHGVTIANTLGFAWDISVIGVEKRDKENLKMLVRRGAQQLQTQKNFSTLVIPAYGKEPNITL